MESVELDILERKKGKPVSRLALVCSIVATAVVTALLMLGLAWNLLGTGGLSLLEAMVIINSGFVGPYEQSDAVDSALAGMVSGLNDRWSYYLGAEGYRSQIQSRDNAYVGIGVTVSYEKEEGLEIRSVARGGPAEAMGLTAGEIITWVDGLALSGENRYDAVALIKGEEGTEVTLKVLSLQGETRTVTLTRSRVEEVPVEYELLENGVGLVTLKNFFNRSAEQLRAAVDDLIVQGATSLVFDLRNNPGGYVTELTDMLDYLLPEGPIFRSEDRAGNEEVVLSDDACIRLPMAVLVNENTYSAAEFFAAELREQDWALVAGTATFGKGYAQQTFPLPNGGGLNISTSKYFTGGGVSLIGTGVVPEPYVELTDAENAALYAGTLARADDPQLQAAIAALKEK